MPEPAHRPRNYQPQEFTRGQRILCIHGTSCTGHPLTTGRIYTVISFDRDEDDPHYNMVRIRESTDTRGDHLRMFANRFIPQANLSSVNEEELQEHFHRTKTVHIEIE
jgi:hypothetical protein